MSAPARTGDESASSSAAARRGTLLFDALCMSAFVVLGLPDGMIGTAWPAMRRSFHAPLADLGLMLLLGTLGGLASSLFVGLMLKRFGFRSTVISGALAGLLGATGVVLAPAFWALLVAGVAIGVAAGFIDGSVNTSIALAGRNRLLNLLHGGYGIGTTIGPLAVTTGLLLGSWRAAYAALILVELSLATAWWRAGRLSPVPGDHMTGSAGRAAAGSTPSPAQHPVPAPSRPAPSRLRVVVAVAVGLVVFMLYVGVEVSAGQWAPSFDRGLLHLGAGATGVATFGYWGALTLGRFALALPRRQLDPVGVVRWGCVAAVAGASLVWWRPSPVVALLGLVVIGGAFAGVFPALVLLTPRRVGEELSHHVIGWQVGASGIGGSVLSAVLGWVFQNYGLAQFGPALTVTALVLLGGAFALERFPDLVPGEAR